MFPGGGPRCTLYSKDVIKLVTDYFVTRQDSQLQEESHQGSTGRWTHSKGSQQANSPSLPFHHAGRGRVIPLALHVAVCAAGTPLSTKLWKEVGKHCSCRWSNRKEVAGMRILPRETRTLPKVRARDTQEGMQTRYNVEVLSGQQYVCYHSKISAPC